MRPNIMYANTLDSKHKLLLGWQGDGSWVSYDAGDRTGTGGVSKTFQQTFHIYIYNPPVHPSMIQQQARRISPVRFFFDGLQNQLRSDLRRAQICVVVQHGALVASDIHPNKLHNEE